MKKGRDPLPPNGLKKPPPPPSPPKTHQCCTCGYEWKHGEHGGHGCSDYLLKKIASLKNVIKNMIRINPGVPGEMGGDISCFYCGVYLDGNEPHDTDCPYIVASKLIEND